MTLTNPQRYVLGKIMDGYHIEVGPRSFRIVKGKSDDGFFPLRTLNILLRDKFLIEEKGKYKINTERL